MPLMKHDRSRGVRRSRTTRSFLAGSRVRLVDPRDGSSLWSISSRTGAGREFPAEISLVRRRAGRQASSPRRSSATCRTAQALEEQLTRQALTDSLTGLAEPGLASRPARHRGRAARPQPGPGRGDDARHGPIQGRERQPRARRRRRDAQDRRGPDPFGRARWATPSGVSAETSSWSSPRISTIRATSCSWRTASSRRYRRPWSCTASSCTRARASESRWRPIRRPRQTSCCATRTSRCTGPKSAAAARPSCSTTSSTAKALARLELEGELRRAIDEEQLRVFYQPVVSFDGGVSGFEALVRWEHPERGLVSPADFIPLAEETGLVVPLGAWVLQRAAAQVASWQETIDPALEPVGEPVEPSARGPGAS